MFDEQLDFARNKDLDEDNYFIYNTNEPKLERNYISDLNQAEIYTGISNEHKVPFIPMETQLDYLQQPSLPVFPIDKPNPLFYNSEIEQKGNTPAHIDSTNSGSMSATTMRNAISASSPASTKRLSTP